MVDAQWICCVVCVTCDLRVVLVEWLLYDLMHAYLAIPCSMPTKLVLGDAESSICTKCINYKDVSTIVQSV